MQDETMIKVPKKEFDACIIHCARGEVIPLSDGGYRSLGTYYYNAVGEKIACSFTNHQDGKRNAYYISIF